MSLPQTRLARQRPPRPTGRVVMRPQWKHLLFLHWAFDPETVQALLPRGLQVDTFEGRAYVGLVPFVMAEVRPHFVPALGAVSRTFNAFPELNVRTYVVRDGVPGVWFFSLDAAGAAAVLTARVWFKLPYFKARMRSWCGRDGSQRYWSKRLWPTPLPATCSLRYSRAPRSTAAPAPSGSLEEFLVERYILYSQKNARLYRGRVWHEPYPLETVRLHHLRENCLAAAGVRRPSSTPHALYSPGVNVEVWSLERCD